MKFFRSWINGAGKGGSALFQKMGVVGHRARIEGFPMEIYPIISLTYYFKIVIQNFTFVDDKAKPVVRQGRKATGVS
jgi:hypothetical protein